MLFRITFEDHGQDFLTWVIDTEKEEVVECEPFQATVWIGKKTRQKAFEVGGEVQFIDDDTGETFAISYPIESIDTLFERRQTLMRFKDAPIGARLKCPGIEGVFVKLNSYPEGPSSDGRGLVCSWHGNVEGRQSFCGWVDKENGIDFDTLVVLV